MNLEKVSKTKAFFIHLSISLAIFSILAAAMLLYWFPGPFFTVDGGWHGMRIIAAVDVVLGPSLTLLFFRPKSKTHRDLLFDLCAIGLAQTLALCWGIYTVYTQHTVAVVFSKHQFYSITYEKMQEANAELSAADKHPIDVAALDSNRPRLIYVRPLKIEEYGEFLTDIMNDLPEIQLRSDRYEALNDNWENLTEFSLNIDEIEKSSEKLAEELRNRALDEQLLFPAQLRYGKAIMVFDKNSKQLLDIVQYKQNAESEPTAEADDSPTK